MFILLTLSNNKNQGYLCNYRIIALILHKTQIRVYQQIYIFRKLAFVTMTNVGPSQNRIKIQTEVQMKSSQKDDYPIPSPSNISVLGKSCDKMGDASGGSSKKLRSPDEQPPSKQEKKIIQRVMQLEGQCKIKNFEYISFDKPQAILVTILLVLTVLGLFLLKYSVWFRRKAFYKTSSSSESTHLYITGNDKKNDIVKILCPGAYPIYFQYKKLKYSISAFNNQKPTPVTYQFQRQFQYCFHLQRLKKGLTLEEVAKRRDLYGPNQHSVETPSYPSYLLDVMTEPFFILQYFFCVMFVIESYFPLTVALLVFSLLTTTVNYIMLYISYKKIKQIAEKQIKVNVVRNGEIINIDSKQLVPGDVYIPQQRCEIPADCIVGYGDIYVNQANLTGQSFPIGKFKIQYLSDIQNHNMWIYQGSKTLETKKNNTYTVVINTGFTTHRGRIIRKIMNRTIKDPDIIRTTLIFVLEVVIVSLIIFFATLFLILDKDIDRIIIFFKFIQFLSSSAPPPLPIFFNLAYSMCLFRLGYKGIIGTQPQKTVDGAQIKTFCFDKTGTLTRSDVSISKIFKLKDQKAFGFHNVIAQLGQPQNYIIWQLFATCHTTKLIQGQLLGDQIDKQMFNFINAKMQTTNDPNIRFIVKSVKDFEEKKKKDQLSLGKQQQDLIQIERKRRSLIEMQNQFNIEVLKINQFESKFQSMSVLVRDKIRGRYFIFVKGSPQKILANSINIQKQSQNSKSFISMIKTLSLNGFRTIAMGYKQLKNKQEVQDYLKLDRQRYLENITNLGMIAFENRLKVDTWLTIHRLVKSNIQPKMITGDNIYIAVETARRSGILQMNQKVVFLQGNRNLYGSVKIEEGKGKFSRIFQGTIIQKLKQDISENQTSNFRQQIVNIHEKSDYLKGGYTFAVDNNFLTMDPPPLLSHKIKVFARIPPENKAFVIRQYKKQHNQYIRIHYSKFTRWLKTKTWKIGMCGDGANDLLALRQADLSIGIQATDASYGSSFTVKNMLDVDWVIKQSKCTQSNIIQLYQYFGSISMFVLICTIILVTEVSYFSTAQLMYLNFGTVLLITGTMAMSRPSGQQSPYVPDANMMGLHNHLIFWGNFIIPFGGILGAFFYYISTSQFRHNPDQTARIGGQKLFNSKNHATTLIYVLVLMVVSFNALIIYRSRPWKQRFFRNYLFTLLIIIDLAIAFIFAFMTKELQNVFQYEPISNGHMGICVGILMGALFLNLVYNVVIGQFKLDHKLIVLQKQEDLLASLIIKKGKKQLKIADSLIV